MTVTDSEMSRIGFISLTGSCLVLYRDVDAGNCPGWAREGYCESEQSVQANCRKSCQLCDQEGMYQFETFTFSTLFHVYKKASHQPMKIIVP